MDFLEQKKKQNQIWYITLRKKLVRAGRYHSLFKYFKLKKASVTQQKKNARSCERPLALQNCTKSPFRDRVKKKRGGSRDKRRQTISAAKKNIRIFKKIYTLLEWIGKRYFT